MKDVSSSLIPLIWYHTGLISHLFDIPLVWYSTCLISHLFDIPLIWCPTHLKSHSFDTSLFDNLLVWYLTHLKSHPFDIPELLLSPWLYNVNGQQFQKLSFSGFNLTDSFSFFFLFLPRPQLICAQVRPKATMNGRGGRRGGGEGVAKEGEEAKSCNPLFYR